MSIGCPGFLNVYTLLREKLLDKALIKGEGGLCLAGTELGKDYHFFIKIKILSKNHYDFEEFY